MGVVDTLTEWRAQRWLATLASRFGTEGLHVAAAVPRLGAAVDQHAAAVRDVLQQGVVQPGARSPGVSCSRVTRAAFSTDRALRRGGPRAVTLWIDPDWLTLRLLAVCALHRALPPAR